MTSPDPLTAQYQDHVSRLQSRYEDICNRLGLDAVLLHSDPLQRISRGLPARPRLHDPRT